MNEASTADMLAAFAAALRDNERSCGTIEKYLRDTRRFLTWLGEEPISHAGVLAWRDHLLSRGYRPVTINSMLSAVNRYLRFLGREDCRVGFLRIQRRAFRDPARELTREEYERLVRQATHESNHRLALLLQTLCATGMRVSELPYVTVQAARSGWTEVLLKGKVRTILFPHRLCVKLLAFAHARRIDSGAIFCARAGCPITRKQVWREMKRLAIRADVALPKVFPHNLRHLFAVRYYHETHDIVQLADLLGHSSIETTRIYLACSGQEHLHKLEQLSLLL